MKPCSMMNLGFLVDLSGKKRGLSCVSSRSFKCGAKEKKEGAIYTHLLTPHSVVLAVNKSPAVFIFIHTHDDPLREIRTSVNRLGLGEKGKQSS